MQQVPSLLLQQLLSKRRETFGAVGTTNGENHSKVTQKARSLAVA